MKTCEGVRFGEGVVQLVSCYFLLAVYKPHGILVKLSQSPFKVDVVLEECVFWTVLTIIRNLSE